MKDSFCRFAEQFLQSSKINTNAAIKDAKFKVINAKILEA